MIRDPRLLALPLLFLLLRMRGVRFRYAQPVPQRRCAKPKAAALQPDGILV